MLGKRNKSLILDGLVLRNIKTVTSPILFWNSSFIKMASVFDLERIKTWKSVIIKQKTL